MKNELKPGIPLDASQLCVTWDASIFDFKTTKELVLSDDLVGALSS